MTHATGMVNQNVLAGDGDIIGKPVAVRDIKIQQGDLLAVDQQIPKVGIIVDEPISPFDSG